MSIEVMQQALEALEEIHPGNMTPMAEEAWNKAITALRTAIEQAEKQAKPFGYFQYDIKLDAWIKSKTNNGIAFYTTPPASQQAEKQDRVSHQRWCASLTQLLLSDPPRPAPCNCTPPAAQSQDSGIETVAAKGGLLPQQEPVAKKPCPACGGPLVECQHCEGEGYEPGTDNDVTGPALCRECGGLGGKRNTTPPAAQREWVGLTDEDIKELWDVWKDALCLDLKTWAFAIEAKLKEKNT